jgi:signal transduction histidine kinase
LPRKVEFAFLGFAVCNLLMAFFLVWTVLLFEKSKNESQLKIAEMARGMAHDIRSPLSALEMTVASIDLPERSKKIILGATGKIGGLARDLLEHSKAIRSNISDKAIRESVNLSQVISVAVEEKIELNREVSFVLNLGVGGVIAEKYHLERIISNILDNSIESRRENEKLEIKVSSKVNGRKVNLYIRDNGVGIEHSVMSKIGNEGFSVGKKNGNGLGLYMAKKKIKEWGGDFSISSNQDAGTLVVLTLLSDNKIPQG